MRKSISSPSRKKITVSLNLEDWLWNIVDEVTDNRSKFFRELLLDEIKQELISQKVMVETGEVTELLGEVYANIYEYKSKLKGSMAGRKPVRRKITKQEEFRSKAMGVHMEKWLWDATGKITPNRSVFFKGLLVKSIKVELVREGVVEADASITREHAKPYIRLKRQQKKYVS